MFFLSSEEGIVCFRPNKPQLNQGSGKISKPLPRSLLKSLKRLVQLTNHLPLALKPWWKRHINLFKQVPIQKSIINIKLTKILPFHCSHCQKALDRNHFGNKGKGFNIINPFLLSEPFSHQLSLMPLY